MELAFATRVTIAAGAAVLAVVLILFGPSPAPVLHRAQMRRRLRKAVGKRPVGRRALSRRLRSAKLMYYVAAVMAVLLGGVVALSG